MKENKTENKFWVETPCEEQLEKINRHYKQCIKKMKRDTFIGIIERTMIGEMTKRKERLVSKDTILTCRFIPIPKGDTFPIVNKYKVITIWDEKEGIPIYTQAINKKKEKVTNIRRYKKKQKHTIHHQPIYGPNTLEQTTFENKQKKGIQKQTKDIAHAHQYKVKLRRTIKNNKKIEKCNNNINTIQDDREKEEDIKHYKKIIMKKEEEEKEEERMEDTSEDEQQPANELCQADQNLLAALCC
mmetsp:Transcript_13614/g.20633  ORF Transcript_13614/g.20633 Transcript_13614/m.20633 type:complete len:243 (+) Transcript_13614:96-824(+)